jgi:hypothetical protein
MVREFLPVLAVAATLTAAPAWADDGKSLVFAVTKWNTARYETRFMDECPEGLNPGNLEILYSTLTPAQRRALPVLPATELRYANFRGRNGEDICVYPTSVDDPPLKTVEGKYAYGFDLDGGDKTGSCAHQDFTGLDGTPGVDNQMYRLLGCVSAWRVEGHIENNANAHRISSGLGMVLIEITGIDDLRNDDDIRIAFYRGTDPFVLDSAGRVLPYSSYTMDTENGRPRYGDVVRGKIVDGTITTEPADVTLPFFGNYQFITQRIGAMRLSMEIGADGASARGLVGGYYEVEQLYSYVRGMLGAFPNTHHFSCSSIYVAAHRLADGNPDPATGRCTTLSSAFHFEAVAAFINRPAAEQDVASTP